MTGEKLTVAMHVLAVDARPLSNLMECIRQCDLDLAGVVCAPYATFGSQALSDGAVAALLGRRACLLANHGLITTGADISAAIDLAVEVEQLARQYMLSRIGGEPIRAPLGGMVRGLIDPARPATPGLKIADIDPRADPAACFQISDKALSVGGGVLEAVLTWMNRSGPV